MTFKPRRISGYLDLQQLCAGAEGLTAQALEEFGPAPFRSTSTSTIFCLGYVLAFEKFRPKAVIKGTLEEMETLHADLRKACDALQEPLDSPA